MQTFSLAHLCKLRKGGPPQIRLEVRWATRPPDVMQMMQQADQGLIPTERFAQQEEKIINGELQADKKKQ